ncbi:MULTISPECIES: phosphonate C-P lyase system protein PhnG [unclassified Xanthobacter]|uniref:phosphonate C-P lyase system protein PhnG n=1 Tax=unclassified Xanthobacter TaxID=2623496 RepID=UPI0021025771|nr:MULTISPECIES: phosphonate C-P lyase system protein PhnG [unclassified Xanthobacter]
MIPDTSTEASAAAGPAVSPPASAEVAARQALMGLLARATLKELEAAIERFQPLPKLKDLRPAEVGLVMVQGRAGGDGGPFNLGEATVTRAAVQLEGGATGMSYLLGRAPARARAAAVLDALWQDPALRLAVDDALRPLRRRLAAEAAAQAAETEATKVNFFTMTRGED